MDDVEREAIQTDVYLDRLLASRWDRPVPMPAADEGPETDADAAPDPAEEARLRATAELLRRTLVRFHPSFRFEEALAARLRVEGDLPPPESLGRLIPFRPAAGQPSDASALPTERRARGLLVGGAIASGVSIASIAGAVIVWRRARGAPTGHVTEQVV